MSLGDLIAAQTRGSRILTIDIERFPIVGVFWDRKVQGIIPVGNILERSRMSCFGAKWYDEPDPIYRAEYDFDRGEITASERERMILCAWELLDAADIVVTFNGISFDHKHLNDEFALAGLTEPSPFKRVDLYRMARTKFGYDSMSLASLAGLLDVPAKLDSGGMGVVLAAMRGEREAWEHLRTYNLGDITTTEALYDRLRGWMPSHPHLGEIAADEMRCNQCGGTDLVKGGLYRAVVIDYVAWTCRTCGAHLRSGAHSRSASTRGV